MRYRLRTCVLILLVTAGGLVFTPARADAQRSRIIAQAAVNQYLNGGYGGYPGAFGYPRYYGGYTTAYGSGYSNLGHSVYGYGGSYPLYGYNNGGYGYGYGGGYPAYSYGLRRSAFGDSTLYGGSGYRQGFYYDGD
jgi:hypothetical protein